MNRVLKLGVIGCGQRAAILKHAHQPDEGVEIKACCDLDPSRAQTTADLFSAKAFTDYAAMLKEKLDAIFVLSPDYLHFEHASAALQANCDVYLEKPMATSIKDCDQLIELAAKQKKLLYLGHNMRHLQLIREIKRLLDEKVIGDLKAIWCRHFVGHGGDFYFRDWHADRRYTHSLLLQKAVHDFDVFHWLAGSSPVSVQAMGANAVYSDLPGRRQASEPEPAMEMNLSNWPPESLQGLNPVIDVEDISCANIRLANGVQVSYQQCHFTPDYWRNYTFIGTEGRLENFGDFLNAEIHIWNRRCSYQKEGHTVIPVPVNEGSHGGADEKIIDEFLTCLKTGQQACIQPEEARNAVAVACCATESLRNGESSIQIP